MKIAVVDTTIDGELIGGAQVFLIDLLGRLVRNGHAVHFVTRGEPNEKLYRKACDTGVTLHSRLWNHSDLVDDATPVFARWVNQLAPDIFLISASGDMGWSVLPLLDSRIAKVSIAHSNSTGFYDPLRHYKRFINRAIGVSHEICEMFDSYCGVDRKRIQEIPYGVTASDTPPESAVNSDRLRLVYVGRLAEPDKKVSDLIKIVKSLRRSALEFSLKIVGDGPMKPEFDAELADEIAAGRVEMLGWLDRAEVLQHLRESEVSLLVSESEGFCIALVEAMANGCCPLVTDIPSGNQQLVRNGENGFAVPVGDVDSFVERLGYLSTHRDKLLEFRQKAWETGRQYSLERMVESYERCFEQAIENARQDARTPDPTFPLMESCRSKYPLWLRRIKSKVVSQIVAVLQNL